MTETRFPDIEIYLKDPDLDALFAWLRGHYPQLEVRTRGMTHDIDLGDGHRALLVMRVVKQYASLWFKDNATPWATDGDCARAVAAALGCETRYQAQPWHQDEDPDDEAWVRVTGDGERTVRWRT